MQDPNAANAATNVPLLAGFGGDGNNTYTISRDNSAFRLTIILGSGDGANVTFTSAVDDGTGVTSVTPIAHTADGLFYHTYDISAGTSDVTVALSANGNFGATGFAIDNFVAVPEPSSAALIGLSGLALTMRRRR